MSDDAIHIMCAADANYGAYAGIMLLSVARNTKYPLHFHIFSDNITVTDVEKLHQISHRYRSKITIYDINEKLAELPSELNLANHISRSTYSRIFFADFIKEEYGRIIYLDCDVVCKKDISKLWLATADIDMIAAAVDPWLNRDSMLKSALGLGTAGEYFNAGVLVINTKTWRSENIENALYKFILKQRGIANADQDALNALLHSRVRIIGETWNTMINLPDESHERGALNNASIIHYVGGFKPWHFGYSLRHGYKSRYYRMVKLDSPWRWKMPDMQFKRIEKKILRVYKRLFHKVSALKTEQN